MDLEQVLQNIKIKLSLTDDDESDALLEVLCNDAYQYMYVFFDCDPKSNYINSPPAELQFVLEAVVIKRFRRIGAEGIAIEKIDVLTTTYEVGDDFAEYHSIMNRYKRNKSKKGFGFF